jgi:hypothetical protein
MVDGFVVVVAVVMAPVVVAGVGEGRDGEDAHEDSGQGEAAEVFQVHGGFLYRN